MTLPSFIEARFPSRQGWEYTCDWVYEVGIATSGQGAREQRMLTYEYPRRRITVRIPPDLEADLQLVKRWVNALRGRAIGFRFSDPSDFLSIDFDPYQGLGSVTHENTTALDQPVVPNGETEGYRLVKEYSIGWDETESLSQLLPIYRPYLGRIQVANETEQVQPPERWTISPEGVLLPFETFIGTPTTWGGQYDLPMRFNSSLPLNIKDMRMAESVFELIELPRGEF